METKCVKEKADRKYRFFIPAKLHGNEIWTWWNGLLTEQPNRDHNTDFFLLVDIFVVSKPFSSPKVSLRTSSDGGNTGLYSFTLTLKPACLPSMALCVHVYVCLNGCEGTRRQDWLLSSNERASQGISLKKVNSLGTRVEQETLP